jgi:hypothetical protein
MVVKNSIHPDVLRYPHPIVKADKLKKGAVREFAILGKAMSSTGTPRARLLPLWATAPIEARCWQRGA